jgi:glycosyltransferase involved in cell wall biosynthesis
MPPLLTVVIPAFNRAALIGRAITSCLSQSFSDFALIVVDDGSTDDTCEVVARYADPRITLLKQEQNQGVGPARNRGADTATSDWLVFLDSDDELTAGALETIAGKLRAHVPGVDAFFFRCRTDDGSLSPSSMPPPGPITYAGYLQHVNACAGGKRDSLWCRKKATFATVRYPDNFALEDLYHLDFNRAFSVVACPEIVRLYHQDADDQLVKRVAHFDKGRDLRFARERADVLLTAIRIHGEALRRHAPLLLEEFVSRLLVLRLMCGDRRKALGALGEGRRLGVRKPAHAGLFLIGAADPSLLMFVRSMRSRRRRRAPDRTP